MKILDRLGQAFLHRDLVSTAPGPASRDSWCTTCGRGHPYAEAEALANAWRWRKVLTTSGGHRDILSAPRS